MCPWTSQFAFGEEFLKAAELEGLCGLLQELSVAVRKNTSFISFPFLCLLGVGFSSAAWSLNSHSLFISLSFGLSKHRKLQRALAGGLERDSWKWVIGFWLLPPLGPHTSVVIALKRASQKIWLVYGLVKTLHNSLFSFSRLYPASPFFKERAVATQPKESYRERK